MANIKQFNKFYFESLETNNLKELPLFLSRSFKKLLTVINSDISKKLLKLCESEKLFQFSYIEIKDVNNISIIAVNRVTRIEGVTEDDLINPKENSVIWGEKYRQLMGIGTFVAKLLPDYRGTKELEEFVNQYRAQLDVFNYDLKIVRGEEIRYWYHVKTYYNPTPDLIDRNDIAEGENDPRTTLMKSCLKQAEKQPFFDIYTKNVNQVGMLIMTDQNNKLRARAIVWFDCYVADDPTNPSKGVFLDRIYYTNESDVNIFINYAKEKGWWYKPSQQKEIYSFIMNGEVCNKSITTRLKVHGEFNSYPYVDTLCYYTPVTGRLSSTRGRPAMMDDKFLERYQLHNTGGSKKRLSHDR